MAAEKKAENNEYILSHRYNPKFELLSKEEVEELLKRYNVTLLQLPKIKASDPVCKLFKAKPNDVFKITRKSPTAGESVFYRVVING